MDPSAVFSDKAETIPPLTEVVYTFLRSQDPIETLGGLAPGKSVTDEIQR